MREKPADKTMAKMAAENEELRAQLEEALETLRAIREGDVDSLVIPGADGEEVRLLVSAQESMKAAKESRLALLSVIEDQNAAVEALRESEERFRLLFEQSPDGIVILDPETARPLEFNEAAHLKLGYSREEFARLTISDIEVDEAPDETKARIAGVFKKGREDFEARHRTRDGEIRYMHVSVKIIELEERPLYLCVWRDITDQKQTEAALLESEQRLAQAKNLETIGLIAGGVAHEVRNPLFAITTIVAALERKLADQPEFGEYVAHIKDQSSRLNQLMNDLLILGRPVEDATFLPCELGDILNGAQRQFAAGASSPRKWLVDSPKEPLVVRGIADKLVQVFLNVTGNAAAFSPEGQPIRIRLWREGDSAFVAVSDSGPGISEDLLPKIYQPFASKRKGGTGLGLAIVQKIVQSHGGTVDARNNDPPPGATFTVRLPLASKEAPEGP
jgi:two-component system cell cycle sensor histidine kinase/response regulator CckA